MTVCVSRRKGREESLRFDFNFFNELVKKLIFFHFEYIQWPYMPSDQSPSPTAATTTTYVCKSLECIHIYVFINGLFCVCVGFRMLPVVCVYRRIFSYFVRVCNTFISRFSTVRFRLVTTTWALRAYTVPHMGV